MNIKNAFISTAIAASIAAGLAAPTVAQNTGETGTRTPRSGQTSQEGTRLRGDMDETYVNWSSGGFIGFLRMDMESEFAAEMLLDLMGDPDLMAEELDIDIEGSFRVRGMGQCTGLYGDNDGMDMYIIFCIDGTYAHMVMASDKQDGLDVMDSVQNDGRLVLPRGYEPYD